MGIRPEHMRLPREGDAQTIRGDVFLVENLGMSDLISLRVYGDENLTIRALLPSDAHWSRENLELAIPPGTGALVRCGNRTAASLMAESD